MLINPEVVTQSMADNPFHHALTQATVYHSAQGLRQAFIADNFLDASPEAQYRFAAGVGGEIL